MDNSLVNSLERQLLMFMTNPYNQPRPSVDRQRQTRRQYTPNITPELLRSRTSYGVSDLITIIQEYQRNMRLYIENMSSLIELLSQQIEHENSNTTQNIPPPPRLRRNNRSVPHDNLTEEILFSYYFPTTNSTNQTRLQASQIADNTRLVVYDASMNETRCPISLDEFIVGEQVLQITPCSHIFNPVALREWFRRNSYCPVCRYNLATRLGTQHRFTTTAPPENNANEEEGIDDGENMTTTTNRFEFEIPIYMDMSNNVLLDDSTQNDSLTRSFGRELANLINNYISTQRE